MYILTGFCFDQHGIQSNKLLLALYSFDIRGERRWWATEEFWCEGDHKEDAFSSNRQDFLREIIRKNFGAWVGFKIVFFQWIDRLGHFNEETSYEILQFSIIMYGNGFLWYAVYVICLCDFILQSSYLAWGFELSSCTPVCWL